MMMEEHKSTKRVIKKLMMGKDNSANVAERLLVGTVASGTPLSSLRTLKRELPDFETRQLAVHNMYK